MSMISSSTHLATPDDFSDNCGFGLIAHIEGQASHDLVKTAINGDTSLSDTQKATEVALLNAAKVTVSGCLNALGVPTNTQVARYALTQTLSK